MHISTGVDIYQKIKINQNSILALQKSHNIFIAKLSGLKASRKMNIVYSGM
jgi:hypothetical protein